MGWERKRGKLHELNRLLRGATDTNFIAIDGRPPIVPDGVRYVITLDADTRVPRDAARRVVGKMAHPLNAPRFRPRTYGASRRDTECSSRASPLALPTGPRGLGLPTRVLQRRRYRPLRIRSLRRVPGSVRRRLVPWQGNLRRRTSSRPALRGRVPDNTLLSHDLFEGIFAHSGLASDIEVVEDFPPRYDVGRRTASNRWAPRRLGNCSPGFSGRGHADETSGPHHHRLSALRDSAARPLR